VQLPSAVLRISEVLQAIDAKAIIVGGYVRDSVLGVKQSKDIDIEVYHVSDIERLKSTLESLAPVYEVGRSFGVLKMDLEGYAFDISLPRTESKSGKGHRGFSVTFESGIEFSEAARRRDFTMNAMGYDIQQGLLLDPYKGQEDLSEKILRVVDPHSFIEDPLRILRAVQFAARFELTMEPNSLKLCQEMVASGMLKELAKERVFDELKKLLLKAKRPSIGFELLDEVGALFSEIKALQGVEQSSVYHPEGDVYTHTMMSIDAMDLNDIEDEKEQLILKLAILCHDFGKPATTKRIDGKIKSIAHETAGLTPTENFIKAISDETGLIEAVLPLVEHHLKPSQFFTANSGDAAIRRLSTKVNIERLIRVAKADFLGRTTKEAKEGVYAAGIWLKQR
jgi:tRNA nucleotidyltransferase (CCA-adding enzyme)